MIRAGQRYVAQEDQRHGRNAHRYLVVLSGRVRGGKIVVRSRRPAEGKERVVRINAERLASSAYKRLENWEAAPGELG